MLTDLVITGQPDPDFDSTVVSRPKDVARVTEVLGT